MLTSHSFDVFCKPKFSLFECIKYPCALRTIAIICDKSSPIFNRILDLMGDIVQSLACWLAV